MLGFVYIKLHERGLMFDRGDFVGVLSPGRHFVPGFNTRVEIVDTLKTRFEHPLLEVLVRHPDLQRELLVLENSDTQRAVIWKDGRAFAIVGTGRFAFWNTGALIEAEVFDIESIRFRHAKVQAILQLPDATRFLDGVQISDSETALLFRDGVLIEQLGQGLHGQSGNIPLDVECLPMPIARALLEDPKLKPNQRASIALHVHGMRADTLDLERLYARLLRRASVPDNQPA